MPEPIVFRKLQRHLDTFPVGFPATASGSEIRILRHLFSETEAKIALTLSFVPTPLKFLLPNIDKILNENENTEAFLENMYQKGLLLKTTLRGESCYSLAQFAIGFYEYQVDRMGEEFAKDARIFADEAMNTEIVRAKIPQLRTIPLNISLNAENKVATYDQAESLILNNQGPFAVANCVCRQTADLAGHPCTYTDLHETCLLFGHAAEHWIDISIARQISQEESLAHLRAAEAAGLVLQPSNSLHALVICCCCGCCCGILRAAKTIPKPIEVCASNFFATIDANTCIGCKLCIPKCHMDAIRYENKKCVVDTDRCIGCGACVITCKKHSISLKDKATPTIPPKSMANLYLSILKRKSGLRGIGKVVTRGLLLKTRYHLSRAFRKN